MSLQTVNNIDVHSFAGITSDSRAVEGGYLFVAIPGMEMDGREYIPQAIAAGASAVLVPEGTEEQAVPTFTSSHIRKDFALLVAKFYGAQPKTMVAVTGTNGKTSVAEFTRQLWSLLGKKAFSIGTLGVIGEDFTLEANGTTPDPVQLQKNLADLAMMGYEHGIVEASSHGLDQYRLEGVHFKVAGFTNFSQDHLDYHKNMEEYFQAKARLFSELLPSSGSAILNADIKKYPELKKLCEKSWHPIVTYGQEASDFFMEAITLKPGGIALRVKHKGEIYVANLNLVGAFQAYNVMCAVALIYASGYSDLHRIFKVMPMLKGVSGRMEQVSGHPSGAGVYIDYAHTPDALETVLKALRPHTKNRLAIVFGCGGDRDKDKRSLMGKAAHQLSDLAYVTDDNPRGEDPQKIRASIMKAAPGAIEVPDRAEAIDKAIQGLQAGDILVIAGKGHEQGQIIGDDVYPFSDFECAEESIKKLSKQTVGESNNDHQ